MASPGERFLGQGVLVTGGASGIGRATARAFAAERAHVMIADLDEKQGKDLVEEILDAGGEASFVRCDIRSREDVDAAVQHVLDTYEHLDVAFNCAGILGPFAVLHDYPEEDARDVVETNLVGTWLCMRAELAVMVGQGHGAIVNMSSAGGLVGFEEDAIYAATKHAILGLTKSAALEYAPYNVRVNAVCPGAVRTPMVTERSSVDAEVQTDAEEAHPLGRLAEPEEVANAVLWLASQDASFVTGEALVVDGGLTAR